VRHSNANRGIRVCFHFFFKYGEACLRWPLFSIFSFFSFSVPCFFRRPFFPGVRSIDPVTLGHLVPCSFQVWFLS